MVDDNQGRTDASTSDGSIWLLAEQAERTAALEYIAKELNGRGVQARVVSLTDVIGTAAREAVAGGAERLLRSLRVVFGAESSGGSESQASGEEDFLGAFRRMNPDVLALTSSRWVRPLSLLESVAGTPTVQLGLLTDFNLDEGWFHGSIDAFVVPSEGLTERLERHDISSDRRYVAGPPVEPRFLDTIDRDKAIAEFGFDDDKRIVMVRAETFAPDVLRKLVFQATLLDTPTQFLFHHNGDGAIANTLRDAADQHGLPAAMFGRVTDFEKYVRAADVVVTSPDEPMIAEITGQKRPVVFAGAAGARRPQVDLITEQYGARHMADIVQFGSAMDRVLEGETLAELEKKAESSSIGPENEGVIESLLDCVARVDELSQPRKASGPEPAEDDEPAGETTGGVPSRHGFEPIGRRSKQQESGGGAGPSLSRAEARDQLAELILRERELERRLDEAESQQSRWRERLDLAREWNEDDLADEAETVLREHIDEAESLRERLGDIRDQKQKLKEAAGRGDAKRAERMADEEGETSRQSRDREDLEERFSDMEIERELDDLRDRIKGELGEE